VLPITKLQISRNNQSFYDPKFKKCLKDHLVYIKSEKNNIMITDVATAWQYKGDFHGVLLSLGVPMELHWITTLINGLDSPTEYDGELTHIIVPEFYFIKTLLSKFLNHTRIL